MKYLRRGIWYIAGRLLVICLVVGLAISIFYYAMNYSNIQIILKDGMASRAKYIMGINADKGILDKYFLTSCLTNDELIQKTANEESPYKEYNVRGINHWLDMNFFWVWPWDNSVWVEITEKIPRIDGRVKGQKADEVLAGGGKIYPPTWPDASYRVQMVRENGQWKIRDMVSLNESQQTAAEGTKQ